MTEPVILPISIMKKKIEKSPMISKSKFSCVSPFSFEFPWYLFFQKVKLTLNQLLIHITWEPFRKWSIHQRHFRLTLMLPDHAGQGTNLREQLGEHPVLRGSELKAANPWLKELDQERQLAHTHVRKAIQRMSNYGLCENILKPGSSKSFCQKGIDESSDYFPFNRWKNPYSVSSPGDQKRGLSF